MIPILWAVLICGCCTSPILHKAGPEYEPGMGLPRRLLMNRKKISPTFSVTDDELREELYWRELTRTLPSWVVLAVTADEVAELMRQKAGSTVH